MTRARPMPARPTFSTRPPATCCWTLNNPTPAASDYFGCSVGVSGGKALIGAYGVDGRGMDVGEAYLFDVSKVPIDLAVLASKPSGSLSIARPCRVRLRLRPRQDSFTIDLDAGTDDYGNRASDCRVVPGDRPARAGRYVDRHGHRHDRRKRSRDPNRRRHRVGEPTRSTSAAQAAPPAPTCSNWFSMR